MSRTGQKHRLIELFEALDGEAQNSLIDFAHFLAQREPFQDTEADSAKHEPLRQPRPADENVINAIKRLRQSYFMLDTDKLLNETSSLMAQNIMQGRPANEVIDDLEQVFVQHYQQYLDS